MSLLLAVLLTTSVSLRIVSVEIGAYKIIDINKATELCRQFDLDLVNYGVSVTGYTSISCGKL